MIFRVPTYDIIYVMFFDDRLHKMFYRYFISQYVVNRPSWCLWDDLLERDNIWWRHIRRESSRMEVRMCRIRPGRCSYPCRLGVIIKSKQFIRDGATRHYFSFIINCVGIWDSVLARHLKHIIKYCIHILIRKDQSLNKYVWKVGLKDYAPL